MEANLLPPANFAMQILLLIQLKSAIRLYINKLKASGLNVNNEVLLKLKKIPIQRIQSQDKVIYGSAIALVLASQFQLAPLEIATQLVTYLKLNNNDVSSQTKLEFTTSILNSGLIHFQLTDLSIAVWLQDLIKKPLTLINHELMVQIETQIIDLKNNFSVFPLQYSHARCCSLLHLGDREGLIKISNDNHKGIVEPKEIPWLNNLTLRLLHPAEKYLITQLLDLVDELNSSNVIPPQKATSRLVKLTISLSEAMINFDRSCRICGEFKTHPQLAQARLGLVAVTQSLLQFMLTDRFGMRAPEEL